MRSEFTLSELFSMSPWCHYKCDPQIMKPLGMRAKYNIPYQEQAELYSQEHGLLIPTLSVFESWFYH